MDDVDEAPVRRAEKEKSKSAASPELWLDTSTECHLTDASLFLDVLEFVYHET